MKWYCKYLNWKGKKMYSRETIVEDRKQMDGMVDYVHDKFKPYTSQCTQEMFKIKDSDGNDMEVYCVKSKKNKDTEAGLGCIIDFHPGGAVMGHPKADFPFAARFACENDVAVFSIRYRLGPEVQYPTGHKDGKAAIEYFIENAAKHGCDPEKICVHGSSGGSWISMGAMILMAREEECKLDKIKLLCLTCPMLNDVIGRMKIEEVEEWETYEWPFRYQYFDMHTTDREANKDDPLLYPGKVAIEELSKMPKCVLQTSEFDSMRRDTHEMIPKMQEAGIYLDHMDYSGTCHGFQFNGDETKHE